MSEVRRVIALERFAPSEQEQCEMARRWTAELSRHAEARPLRPIQGYILETAQRAAAMPREGLLGNVGVGKGKTLAFLLIPTVMGAERPLLLIPPDMREDLERARWEWGQEYRMHPNLRVMAYSELSLPSSTDALSSLWGEGLGPDLIMADECQALRHASAARTKRFLRYMRAHPDTRFVAMSGTLSTTSTMDYWHLASLANPSRSVLPAGEEQAKDWSATMAPDAEPEPATFIELLPLVRAFGDKSFLAPASPTDDTKSAVRRAYFERFRSAPGCIATETDSSDVPLSISGVYPELNAAARDALSTLSEEWVLPDGTEVVDELHLIRASLQLSCGFYYIWDWPSHPDVEWLDARRAWASAVRWYLARWADAGRDSPWLVEQYVRQEPEPPPTLRDALAQWDTQRHKPPPPVRAVWLDTSPAVFAAKWTRSVDNGFVWFKSRAVGEMLQALGVPALWEGLPDRRTHRVCALSERVYHKGKNLQDWNHGLHLEPGANAALWEQLLGRQHRAGQRLPVSLDVCLHTWPLRVNISRAMKRARFLQETMGQPQKLLSASMSGVDLVSVESSAVDDFDEEGP